MTDRATRLALAMAISLMPLALVLTASLTIAPQRIDIWAAALIDTILLLGFAGYRAGKWNREQAR